MTKTHLVAPNDQTSIAKYYSFKKAQPKPLYEEKVPGNRTHFDYIKSSKRTQQLIGTQTNKCAVKGKHQE
jgi:hypothetical protein